MPVKLCITMPNPRSSELELEGVTGCADEPEKALKKYEQNRDGWIQEKLGFLYLDRCLTNGYGIVVSVGNTSREIRKILSSVLSKENPFGIEMRDIDLDELAKHF